MKTLIIAEHDNQTLKSATYHTVTAAQFFNHPIDILVVGAHCQKVAEQACLLTNVDTVLLADHDVYEHQLAENAAALIADIGKQYDYILTAATTFGKNILPRAAALLDVAMVSDVTHIISADTFVRPIYAGNVMATVQAHDKIKVLTIRTTAFAAAQANQVASAKLEKLSHVIPNTLSRFEHQTLTQSTRPELTSARVVISGGRGLKSAENFKLLEALADRLGAAIGASRAAVDAGFAPNDYQVGQTGKVVAPDLYIAVGISGAIQHLAGMKDSKIIVAINKDPDAPIFQIADYALVGDLFTILPALQAELDKVLL
ncbi:MAG: electron transfer flavoprotein subunit alpha/FixB family protein [Gammaproteobacteria bacterium]|nr:MAG: electron transfer flavoprotein subunit alpha/FixB family protein [Gammaproteobacteria bacterium]